MLVFADECGDPGRKTDSGSSLYFIVTTILFEDKDAAASCDAQIDALRQRLSLKKHKEFHFNKDSKKLRSSFLREVCDHRFSYNSFVLNKDELTSPGFEVKESLYKYTVKMAFSNIEKLLHDATVVFDLCGGRDFARQLKAYLQKEARKWAAEDGRRRIKRIKANKSSGNNLIQLADMVGGAVGRSFSGRDDAHVYRRIIQHREHRVQVWPKATAKSA